MRHATLKEIPDAVVVLRGEKPVVLFSALLLMSSSDEAAHTAAVSLEAAVFTNLPAAFATFSPKDAN